MLIQWFYYLITLMPKQSKEKELNKKVTHKDFQGYLEMASEIFATKADLEIFATKADLEDLATKSELLKMKDEILTSNDKLVSKLDTVLTEQTMNTVSYARHDKEIEKVKNRVDRVEKHIGLKSVTH